MVPRLALLLAASPVLLAGASAPVGPEAVSVDAELQQARAEVRAAETDLRRLETAAARARDEVSRLAAERQAAAAAIAASEARISAADAEAKLADALVAGRAAQLARRQAPVAALLTGIISMGRRPPLMSIADSSSLDELVRLRALLDTTLPVIRARSASLSAELADSRRLQQSAASARDRLASARTQLHRQQQRFAALEAKAADRAANLGAGVVGASDVMIATAESEALKTSEAGRRRAAIRLAAELGDLPQAPMRPGTAIGPKPSILYRLPAAARLIEGTGAVSDSGVRSRGLTLDTHRGQPIAAPADGTIAFAGPFRRHDGIVIIDHGGGWMTLLTGVATGLRKGERVRLQEPLGQALGPVSVELSINGMPVSAALIAGSSQMVSNRGKSG
jgi:septal ring factor EnvC (AmiA/AmiB activator)